MPTIFKIEKVWLTDDAVWVRTEDGQEAYEKFESYPRLRWATPEQRSHFEVNAFGIRWEEIDEDLSFDGFFDEREFSPFFELFMAHPELNASAVARRLGIPQSLFARYIGGTKKPSKERAERILEEIRKIGTELQSAHL